MSVIHLKPTTKPRTKEERVRQSMEAQAALKAHARECTAPRLNHSLSLLVAEQKKVEAFLQILINCTGEDSIREDIIKKTTDLHDKWGAWIQNGKKKTHKQVENHIRQTIAAYSEMMKRYSEMPVSESNIVAKQRHAIIVAKLRKEQKDAIAQATEMAFEQGKRSKQGEIDRAKNRHKMRGSALKRTPAAPPVDTN